MKLLVGPLEDVDEGVFGHVDVPDAAHLLLALRLPLEQLHLACDVPAILRTETQATPTSLNGPERVERLRGFQKSAYWFYLHIWRGRSF